MQKKLTLSVLKPGDNFILGKGALIVSDPEIIKNLRSLKYFAFHRYIEVNGKMYHEEGICEWYTEPSHPPSFQIDLLNNQRTDAFVAAAQAMGLIPNKYFSPDWPNYTARPDQLSWCIATSPDSLASKDTYQPVSSEKVIKLTAPRKMKIIFANNAPFPSWSKRKNKPTYVFCEDENGAIHLWVEPQGRHLLQPTV